MRVFGWQTRMRNESEIVMGMSDDHAPSTDLDIF